MTLEPYNDSAYGIANLSKSQVSRQRLQRVAILQDKTDTAVDEHVRMREGQDRRG